MFKVAFIQGYKNMVKANNDIDRLQFMPQRIEDGTMYDFKGNTIFKNMDIKDIEIFDLDRVAKASRFTAALSRDYFEALDKVIPLIKKEDGRSINQDDEVEEPKAEYASDILDAVEKGDRKTLRALLKGYKANDWAVLDSDKVDDAIFDIMDYIDDKDVKRVKEIINDLISIDAATFNVEDDEKTVKKETPVKKEETTTKYVPVDEDEEELIADLEEAVEDEDYEDVELLLKELGEDHTMYSHYKSFIPGKTKEEPKGEEPTKDDNSDIIDEICDDIDAALEDNDSLDAKKYLKELAEEAGEDSDIYKEYDAKVHPPKRDRSSRRERR